MTDVHSHILFGIDDGSKDIEESVALLKEMCKVGFKNVILTPHYITDSKYVCNNQEKQRRFNELKERIQKENIDINIFLGNEIFINDKIAELIEQDEISVLNNTKYILFELPFYNKINNLEDIVYELKINGYIPILAHPERYEFFQKNPKEIDRLREEGFIFQGNYSSIIGHYGKKSQKLLKYMLKKQYIDFLGTDIHSTSKMTVLDNFEKIKKKIIKITGEDYYRKIKSNCNKLATGELDLG